MTNIDFAQVITIEDKAALHSEQHRERVKAACRRRILAVCNEVTQVNLAAANGTGRLMPEQQLHYRALLQWIDDMRQVCRRLQQDMSAKIETQAHWPDLPEGAAELAASF